MHYRTPRISFLEDPEEFLGLMGPIERLPAASFGVEDLPVVDRTLVVVAAAP
jgi:hypothetical protein